MNNVNRTLYIPLYGKSYVSKKGIILRDSQSEEIWEEEGFELKGKSKSKWLAYYMGMRSAVFDNWLREKMNAWEDAVIIHIGCGMDSRVIRVGTGNHRWYDVDFAEVIAERRKYYTESDTYYMIEGDVRELTFLEKIPKSERAIIVMEGVSMYLNLEELQKLFENLDAYFENISMMMDCYTVFAAKSSKYKNPINDVGVTQVYGIDEPEILAKDTGLSYVREHDMTPEYMINELIGIERTIFKNVYGGQIARKLYRLYEYAKCEK